MRTKLAIGFVLVFLCVIPIFANAMTIEPPEPKYPTRDRIIVPRLFIFKGDLHLQEDEVWIRLWVMNHAKREYTFTIGCKIPCIPSWGHPHERVLLGGNQVAKQSILDECREKALSKIGKPVKFSYPKFGKMKGVLVDRVVMHNKSVTGVKDMFRVIDLIEFSVHDEKKQLIRFGYYTLKDGDTIIEYQFDYLLGSGLTHVTATIPVLQSVDKIIEIHISATSPATTITESPQMIQVSGTVVGFTIGATVGTTCSFNLSAIGF